MTSTCKRQRSRAWFFTWNNADEILPGTVSSNFSNCDWVFQKEQGKEGMVHFQGVIRFKNPLDKVPTDIFGLCHWERCRNWRNAVKYCTKVDTRIEGPWSNIDGLTWRKTLRRPMRKNEMYAWQTKLLKILEEEPDFRTIRWYWSKKGLMGKTTFSRELVIRFGALPMSGCNRDCMCFFFRTLEERDVDVVVFNLSRQDANVCSYKTLEILKDGVGFSGKYESCGGAWNPPHVVVFANFEPERALLSEDRWVVECVDI